MIMLLHIAESCSHWLQYLTLSHLGYLSLPSNGDGLPEILLRSLKTARIAVERLPVAFTACSFGAGAAQVSHALLASISWRSCRKRRHVTIIRASPEAARSYIVSGLSQSTLVISL